MALPMASRGHWPTGIAAVGVVAKGLLVRVSTGDWVLASTLFVFGRIGFVAA